MPRGRPATIRMQPVAPATGSDLYAGEIDLLTVNEAAALLRRHRTTVYALMNAGELPWVQTGWKGHRFVPRRAVADYLARHTKQ